MLVPHTDSRYYITLTLQSYTSAPRSLREILISIPQATFITFSHKLFSTHFQWYFLLPATSLPHNKYPQFSPPPISCCFQSGKSIRLSCACGRCKHSVSISYRVSGSFLTHNPDTAFHLHFLHSPQHPTA